MEREEYAAREGDAAVRFLVVNLSSGLNWKHQFGEVADVNFAEIGSHFLEKEALLIPSKS